MNNKPHSGSGSQAPVPMIDVKNLVHIYPNGTKAVDKVSLVVEANERLAVIGQNGSGKTTLVKHFNGLLKPTNGSVVIDGIEKTSQCKTAQLAKKIGFVFQNPNHQLFCVSVYEELCFGLKNLRKAPQEVKAKVEETIELFHLQPYLKAHPYSLSMGVRKLVAIASVFAMGPSLMILDEPTTGQDYDGKVVLSQAIQKVYESGKAVVFVSHDMRFVAEHADRAIVMCQAEKIFDGKLKELFTRQDVLEKANLRPPPVTELGQKLQPWGFPPDVLNVYEMVQEVRRFVQ